MRWRHPEVARRADVMFGAPVLRGTRWPTATVLGWDCDVEAMLTAYPHLTRAQIEAAVAFERTPRRRLGRVVWRLRRRLAAWLAGESEIDL